MRRWSCAAVAWSLVGCARRSARPRSPPSERRSGYELMGPRAAANAGRRQPPIRACSGGARRRGAVAAQGRAGGKSCADCHGDARAQHEGRRGALSRLRSRRSAGRSIWRGASTSAGRSTSRRRRCHSRARSCWRWPPMSRGNRRDCRSPSPTMPRTRPFIAAGREIFERRQGQLNLSCAQCHDDNWGKRSSAARRSRRRTRPGYPLYRLEWQKPRLVAAAPAQLPDRHARRALRLRCAGDRRARVSILPGAPADWRWKPPRYVPETAPQRWLRPHRRLGLPVGAAIRPQRSRRSS